MNRNCLFNKVVALLLCAFMLIGYLPSIALPAAAAEEEIPFTTDEWEGPPDVAETTTEATEPVGSQGNPEYITESASATIAEAESAGYYFIYTNEKSGLLTVGVQNYNRNEGYEYKISVGGEEIASGYYANRSVGKDDGFEDYEYIAGTKVEIWVNTYAAYSELDEDYNYVNVDENGDPIWEITHPAGTVGVNIQFKEGLGTEADPFHFYDAYNSWTIPAGKTYHFVKHGMVGSYLNVSGETGFAVNGVADTEGALIVEDTADGYAFSIANNTESDQYYSIHFLYHEGTVNNPTPVSSTKSYTLNTENGNKDGYWWYVFNAYNNGYLSLNITSEGSYTYEVKEGSTDAESTPVTVSEAGTVTVYDEITYTSGTSYYVIVSGNTADVVLDYEFVVGWGTQDSPFKITEMENTLTVPAGETYFYECTFNGTYLITANGALQIGSNGEYTDYETVDNVAVESAWYAPLSFVIDNSEGTEAVTYSVVFNYPFGHSKNPVELELGDNSVTTVAGDSTGYYVYYIAEQTGTLNITLSSDAETGYMYVYDYTNYASTDADFSNKITVEVTEGDRIDFSVCGMYYDYPATNININLAYEVEEHVHEYKVEIVGLAQDKGNSGKLVYTCECDDSYEVALPSDSSALRFSGASLVPGADLTVNFNIESSIFSDGAYENVYVVYQIEDENGVLSDPVTVTEWEDYAHATRVQYPFKGVATRMMKDTIYATLYGTYNGVECSISMTYTAATYCYNQLGKSTSSQELKNLLVDLLNFGTEHQKYNEYNLDNLINAELTEEQKAFAGSYDLALEKVQNTSYEVIENPTANFNGAGLLLSNAVVVRFKVTVSDLENVVLKVTAGGVTTEIPSSEFEGNDVHAGLNDGQYYVFCSSLKARQMRDDIVATIYKDGQPISNSLLYRIETYAYNSIGNADLSNLLKAMMYYGDSSKTYYEAS